jgi:cold shock CspA family protein
VITGPKRQLAKTTKARATSAVGCPSSFAQIVTEGSGKRVFVHASQLQRGAALRVGSRLTFIEADNGRGPAAYDVQIAK